MNIYSNRSYNDINQYPVFPWIITDYTSKILPPFETSNLNKSEGANNRGGNASCHNLSEMATPLIRPFNTPMGMLDITNDSRERKENYKDHWESLENDDDKDENYDRYGSHYSTSLYLTYYLVRVFPFSYIRIELQGKNFDDPNRLFNSVSNSFFCATSQKADLRELIPEFFCLPEMFYNLNDLNLGEIMDEKSKQKKLVNEIEMPNWCNNDAYFFVKKHRELLESIEINEKINEWFNIIFGSKQKGKKAKDIGNLFLRQTYDDYDDIHKNANLSEQIYQKRMVEFGVTPCQLFKNDTSKRQAVKDLKKKPILFNYHVKSLNMWNTNQELEIKDSEEYLEGMPYRLYSSMEGKNEKIIFLYEDQIRIISKKIEAGFLKKKKNRKNKLSKEVAIPKNSKEIKDKIENKVKGENKEKEETKEVKEVKEGEETHNKINNESDNDDNNSEEENEIKDEEDKYTTNKDRISNYNKNLISPKYRMNINEAPFLIYYMGHYIALGGYWNYK